MDEIISNAYDAQLAGDPGTPAAPPAVADTDSATQSDTATATGDGGTQDGQPTGEQLFDWEQVPAELLPQAKGFQAAFTRKMQEIAEQRRAFEQQQQQLAHWQSLQQLAQEDPAQAAAILKQYAETLAGTTAAPGDTDPYANAEPISDFDTLVLNRLKAMEEQTRRLDEWYQKQQLQAQYTALEQAFSQLETQIGRQIPFEEREKIAAHCRTNGISSLTAGYRDLYWETEIARSKQLGRDEASTVVSAKAAAAVAPSNLTQRQTETPARPANDRELISQLYDEMMGAAT